MKANYIPTQYSELSTQNSEKGQILLIGVLIFLVLIISIPTMIFLNQHAGSHGVMSQKKLKGRTIAEEGIAYAIQQLQLLGALACNTFTGTTFKSSQGGAYTIQCTQGPIPPTPPYTLQNYQFALVATPLDTSINPTNPTIIPGSSIQTIVSQRTLGAKLPIGLSASAAIALSTARNFTQDSLGNTPAGKIYSYFGPMVCWDAATWTLDQNSDSARWPRKFSAGAITGTPSAGGYIRSPTADPPTTDQIEYWAFTDVGFKSVVNMNSYFNAAQNSVIGIWTSGCTPSAGCSSGQVVPSGIFNPTNGSLLFDAGSSGYNAPSSNDVFYINGGAVFQNLALDLKQGAVVIKGDLNIINVGTSGMPGSTPIRVPPTAYLEYQSNPELNWPCHQYQGTDTSCTVDDLGLDKLNFRGFLYVQGDMIVHEDFAMAGVLRVDGKLSIDKNTTLTVIYDDQINRLINVTPYELQVDSTTAIQ